MQRCFALAAGGQGSVAPNPMVGAVLVYKDAIIGEGYHQKYGEAHAEVNCINDALKKTPDLIPASTLYVSLEPCAHFGKTPPCADMIIKHKIPKVVVACRDSFKAVNGRGIEKLKQAGVEVVEDVLKKQATALNKRFFTFHSLKRPYIVLKWAQSADGFIAGIAEERLMISGHLTNRLVHKWRSEETSILVGVNTAIKDDPLLDNRNWYGKPPVKIIIDPLLVGGNKLRLLQHAKKVFVINTLQEKEEKNIHYIKARRQNFLPEMLHRLYELQIQSILVEGGAVTLQSFINAGFWDEARVITNTSLFAVSGLRAPQLHAVQPENIQEILSDHIMVFKNKNGAAGLL